MRNDRADKYAKMIWDYLKLGNKLQKADCMIVLGSHDTRVAVRSVEIYHEGLAPIVVFSGGFGRLTREMWQVPEARLFADIAIKSGIPEEKILIEDKSSNTGENVIFSKKLLYENGIIPEKIIAVQKPYMERRTFATFAKQWPEVEVLVASPELSYEEYCYGNASKGMSRDDIINIMVGDLQRIKVYPQNGFQIEQEIPWEVWDAFEKMVAMGYNKQLLN